MQKVEQGLLKAGSRSSSVAGDSIAADNYPTKVRDCAVFIMNRSSKRDLLFLY